MNTGYSIILNLTASNLHVFMFFLLLVLFLTKVLNSLSLLIISELFWIVLYSVVLIISITLNRPDILALSLYFLMFSASEISMGISIIILQIKSLTSAVLDLLTLKHGMLV